MAIKRVRKSFEFKVIIWMKFCRQVVLGIVNKLLFFESIAVIFWNISSYSRLLCPWFSASQPDETTKEKNAFFHCLTQPSHKFSDTSCAHFVCFSAALTKITLLIWNQEISTPVNTSTLGCLITSRLLPVRSLEEKPLRLARLRFFTGFQTPDQQCSSTEGWNTDPVNTAAL